MNEGALRGVPRSLRHGATRYFAAHRFRTGLWPENNPGPTVPACCLSRVLVSGRPE